MMSTPQPDTSGTGPPRLHRPFRFYDPEVLAVMTILLGLFQLLLGFPTYYLSINLRLLYMCPLFVGAMHVAVGSFAMASERSPSRQVLKNCLYCALGGLLLGLGAIAVYGYAVNDIKTFPLCKGEQNDDYCPREDFLDFFRLITALLLVYDIAALILQCFLSFSAVKGLKTT